MGLCRFWVYVIAGIVGQGDFNGRPIWCGAALAFYIVGLSYVAKRESFRGPVPYWPLIFLIVPILLAMLMDQNETRMPAVCIAVILIVWIIRCVRTVFFGGEIGVGSTQVEAIGRVVRRLGRTGGSRPGRRTRVAAALAINELVHRTEM